MDYAAAYGEMHENAKLFPGNSIRPYKHRVAELVAKYEPERLLDYGCGKGYQYLAHRVHEAWGGLLPHCYDIGVRQLSDRPTGLFDGIICTDVLEHIEEQDLATVLADIALLANVGRPQGAFIFFVISCRPSRKRLPDGRDVHVTVRAPEWWDTLLRFYRASSLDIQVEYDTQERAT